MKARNRHPRRGKDILTKIKLEAFPTEIIVECRKGIGWLKSYRRALKSYQYAIYQAAVATAQQVDGAHYANSEPVITPLDADIIDLRIHVDDIDHRTTDGAARPNIFDPCTSNAFRKHWMTQRTPASTGSGSTSKS
jgi:hypothetical protein